MKRKLSNRGTCLSLRWSPRRGEMQISIAFSRAFATVLLVTLHDRLDARLLDQTAQPHRHGEAKHRGCTDPSRLRGVIKKIWSGTGCCDSDARAAQYSPIIITYCDMPWHVMLVREGGRVDALSRVCDYNNHPPKMDKPDPGTDRTREPQNDLACESESGCGAIEV